ncbi:hypothetical protein H2199_004141 [Coniosporium tulheliwenetii]|uniref:Uncharacterized protein n=1 Tax=Coniosporium tulheliwenetii TaxID=3383036 RepID=A0ACC2Z845_9PEZI|nr:hypothetical protein H2199_004141 [Cladosporium sp. JES 115]
MHLTTLITSALALAVSARPPTLKPGTGPDHADVAAAREVYFSSHIATDSANGNHTALEARDIYGPSYGAYFCSEPNWAGKCEFRVLYYMYWQEVGV